MAAVNHRAVGLAGDGAWDIAEASGGAFGPDPMQVLGDWEAFLAWAAENAPAGGDPYSAEDLTCPLPRPPHAFAIPLNYADHTLQSGIQDPDAPPVFTKFPSCMAAPNAEVPLVPGNCDWEVELVVVIGKPCRDIQEAEALDYVLGYSCGNDVSARALQTAEMATGVLMLGKGLDTFKPLGPCIATDLDPTELTVTARLNGTPTQRASTSDLIFSVASLVTYLAQAISMQPGDCIYTGTPSGGGSLEAGDTIEVEVSGVGVLRNPVVSA